MWWDSGGVSGRECGGVGEVAAGESVVELGGGSGRECGRVWEEVAGESVVEFGRW